MPKDIETEQISLTLTKSMLEMLERLKTVYMVSNVQEVIRSILAEVLPYKLKEKVKA